jgi:hypothetical protein
VTVTVLDAPTLGEAWLVVSRAILEDGSRASYDGRSTHELALARLSGVAEPVG